MPNIEYIDGETLAIIEKALGRVPLVSGPNGRVALVTGLQQDEELTPERLVSLASEDRIASVIATALVGEKAE